MKRRELVARSVAAVLSIVAWLTMLATLASSQDAPAQALEIKAPKEFLANDFNDLEAIGVPEEGFYLWKLEPSPPPNADLKKFPRLRAEKNKCTIVGPPGAWCVEVFFSDGKTGSVANLHFVIPGDVAPATPTIPSNPPPQPVKTLSQLAGDKAAPLGQVYAILKASLGKDIASVEQFPIFEKEALAANGLTGHGATAEIAKRLAVKTLDELSAALSKIIDELAAAPAPSTATAATYVYEKDDGEPSSSVMAGLNRLNRETKIKAQIFEEDTLDGQGQVPDQFKVALEAARQKGLPSLVVTAGPVVLKVVQNPTTAEQVWSAAQ